MYTVYYQNQLVSNLFFNALRVEPAPSTDALTALYSGGVQGGYYDTNDLSTLFQDVEGTKPVSAPNQTIGRVLDKSGNGNHLVQSTVSRQPKLVYNSSKNSYGLSFDGVDDYLMVENFALTTSNVVMGESVDLKNLTNFRSHLLLSNELNITDSANVNGMRLTTEYDSFFSKGRIVYKSVSNNMVVYNLDKTKYVFITENKPTVRLNTWINTSNNIATNPSYVGSTYLTPPNKFAVGYLSNVIIYKSFFIGKVLTTPEINSIQTLLNSDLGAW